jgi:hypothetical protein
MSYNVAICTPPVPAEDDTAWDGLDGLINEQGAPPPVFRELFDALTARYPCICTLPDDKVDEDGVWSDGPLWNDFGHRAAVLGMTWSRVEEVLPFLVRTVLGNSIPVYSQYCERASCLGTGAVSATVW